MMADLNHSGSSEVIRSLLSRSSRRPARCAAGARTVHTAAGSSGVRSPSGSARARACARPESRSSTSHHLAPGQAVALERQLQRSRCASGTDRGSPPPAPGSSRPRCACRRRGPADRRTREKSQPLVALQRRLGVADLVEPADPLPDVARSGGPASRPAGTSRCPGTPRPAAPRRRRTRSRSRCRRRRRAWRRARRRMRNAGGPPRCRNSGRMSGVLGQRLGRSASAHSGRRSSWKYSVSSRLWFRQVK